LSFKRLVSAAALTGAAAVAGAALAASPVPTAKVPAATPAAAAAAAPLPNGEPLFAENCSACHQVTGLGIPGAFPALKGNAYVQGPALPVASTVINGRAGMPSFKEELTSVQVAAILTYVRSAWGNTAGPVDVATVDAARGGATATVPTPSVMPFH
jgi:cytochrome c6